MNVLHQALNIEKLAVGVVATTDGLLINRPTQADIGRLRHAAGQLNYRIIAINPDHDQHKQ